jgi:uncharacterized protein (DUF58 family)
LAKRSESRRIERRREPRHRKHDSYLSESVEIPSFSAAKDTRGHSVFRSKSARVLWKFLTWRLTSAGRWMLIPSVFLFAYASASLTLQAFIPFCYVSALWIIALLSPLLFKPRVSLAVRHAQHVFAGELMPVEVEIEQLGSIDGHDLHVLAHGLPASIDAAESDGVPLPRLKKGERVRAVLGLVCAHRGVFSMNGFRAETDFPFGLWRSYEVFERERRLIVYPRFTALTHLDIPAGRRYQPGGVALAAALGDSVEFVGNREYRSGDNIRNIDWRATARHIKPIVREYREEYLLRVAVVLDTQLPRYTTDSQRQAFESAISICAGVSDYLARKEYVVDILAAGSNLYYLRAGRHLAFIDQILEILACVDAGTQHGFDVIEPELRDNLESISTVVCIFLDWDEPRRRFAHTLRDLGAGVKVILVRNGACTLDPYADESRLGSIHLVGSPSVQAGLGEL